MSTTYTTTRTLHVAHVYAAGGSAVWLIFLGSAVALAAVASLAWIARAGRRPPRG